MELGLSLGEAPARPPPYAAERPVRKKGMGLDLGFCMGLGVGVGAGEEERVVRSYDDPPVQLDLLPLVPVPRHSASRLGFPWAIETGNLEASMRGFDVNRVPSSEAEEGAAVSSSSPNSAVSSFQMDFCTPGSGGGGGEGGEAERASSRASDEEDNGLARKKLRLSKEQSAFLEESFKEHNTLNPKQKLALAKQLNLRPRQVEVWFQNRRARTKLKQTEVDCEYLKRCCETLTEENRRLQKELAELRALKTAHPFYMHLPATTLSMCPSCERVSSATATTTTTPNSNAAADHNRPASFAALFAKPRIFPFAPQPAPPHQPSAAS